MNFGAWKCDDCGTKENVIYGPCPYESDINEDYTDVYLCEECSDNRADDI